MSGKLLLFGFDSLLHILAMEAAMKPFGVELVPVGRTDYTKTLAVRCSPTPAAPWEGGCWFCADWMESWMRSCPL